MSEAKCDSFEGCKTFFFLPDLSIMPEDFITSFFARGFESYYVMDDKHLDLESKVRVIRRLFGEVILFFNIERRINGIDWPSFVRRLVAEHGDRIRVGVLCHRHIGEEAIAELERKYLYDIGIYCGCIPLEYRKSRNLGLLSEVLAANDARGRRNSLRAICGDTSTLNFARAGGIYRGAVRDVSVSHFSCVFEGPEPELKMYEKVDDIQLNLGGIICAVSGVVFAKRASAGSPLYVFVFRDSRGRDGLDPEMHGKVNGFIQRHFEQAVRTELSRGFGEEIAALRSARAEAGSTSFLSPSMPAP